MSSIDGVGGSSSRAAAAWRLAQRSEQNARTQNSDGLAKAKGIVNAQGVSLYDARDKIMASVQDAMSKVGPNDDKQAAFQKAMDQALKDNGFDPAQIKQQMGSQQNGSVHHGRHGHHHKDGGATAPAAGAAPTKGTAADPDQMMQQLLSGLPAGTTVDKQA